MSYFYPRNVCWPAPSPARAIIWPFASIALNNRSSLGAFSLRASLCLFGTHRLSSMLCSGSKLVGQSGRTYVLISPLGTTRTGETPNVWKAVNDADETEQFVIKEPSSDDDPSIKYPAFQHEIEMQQIFKDSPMIRPMVDFVPTAGSDRPKMALQGFEKTLWTARNRREFSNNEIKWIMKSVLLGLWTVHRQGLVYSDLKMENVVINEFVDERPGDLKSIIVRLADCGLITKPSDREITSITYRSPEVYFRKPWTTSTNIRSWGIMPCHLLEAQASISSPGIYDSIRQGSLEEKAQVVRTALAYDFKLHEISFYAKDERSQALLPPKDEYKSEQGYWADKLLYKGVQISDIEFLLHILNPVPNERWTAAEISNCGYLDIDSP